MWQSTVVRHPGDLVVSSLNLALQGALSSSSVPGNVVVKNSNQELAESDSERRQLFPSGVVQTFSVTPWSHGEFSGSKRNMGWYLSPLDAQAAVQKALSLRNWDSAVLIMMMADNEDQLFQQLQSVSESFPCAEVSAAMRRADALSRNEAEKRFMAGDEVPSIADRSLASISVFSGYSVAAQNVAVSEAVASDESPSALLNSFIGKRVSRLQKISEDLLLAVSGGHIPYALSLTGGDLASKLTGVIPPNSQAPLCCIVAIGGSSVAMNKIIEVSGL